MSDACKYEVLKTVTFGKRIAEEEGDALGSYFVETDQWRKLVAGEVDVVYGAKGSGKSAIYSLLLRSKSELRKRGISVVPAEKLNGTPIFKDLVADPPASEAAFRSVWKLYFLSLLGAAVQAAPWRKETSSVNHALAVLEQCSLILPAFSLRGILKGAMDYVSRVQIEPRVDLDQLTGLPRAFGGRISLKEPSHDARRLGIVSADELLEEIDAALAEHNESIWIALDRLDVAFADSDALEGNGLRALFRVYLDLVALKQIKLKIFLRDDIWKRISAGGFREATHITRSIRINWDSQSLLNLIIRRALHNELLRTFYDVESSDILSSTAKQRDLFYRIFPRQVDAGARKPSTLDWMLSRTADSTSQTAPRELIHLLASARDVQLRHLELGNPEPADELLFDRDDLKEAMPEVSKVRFEQTLLAEYPHMASALRKLENGKTQQTVASLARIWGVKRDEASKRAEQLVDIGFFERRETTDEPSFWIPFLYRDALRMLQGPAEKRRI